MRFLYPDLPEVPENLRGTYGEAEFTFQYNDTNNNINRVFWVVPELVQYNIVARDRDTNEVVFTTQITGPDSGESSVPGNTRMADYGEGYLELPWHVDWGRLFLWGNNAP